MNLAKHLLIILGLMVSMSLLSSCGMSTREKIESGLKEPLSVYPTKNLEDFYDKEGYRDSNFSKDDKGVWSVYTSIGKSKKDGILSIEGTMLYIDRNTRKSEGYFFIDEIVIENGRNSEKKYPIIMKNNQLILKDNTVDENIKNKVEKFKFFVQYGDLKNMTQYDEDEVSYNAQAPNYLIRYHLKSNDKNLNQIQKFNDITIGQKPKLEIYGDGDFKSDISKSNTVKFILDNQVDNYFNSIVSFKPKRGNINE
ncbi:tandem-type lipoprotein [Staphylococcus hyicus]|uniref:tandem-type lipoprotein n=1 Tax=Staphylococcus hyicus TaxID=1284 RepID=UPI00217D7872|nr:tandem-type lipoprotein [Staphylococcus hyicus]UWF57062.1 tandem-type lipoprotein [Staphylococcus hyicus]